MTISALIDSDLHANDVVIRNKVGVYSVAHNPRKHDILATDGIMMYGYRKVRKINNIGYIMAHNMKFWHVDLLDHVGRWVLVDVSGYWATTARIGWSYPSDGVRYHGIRCNALTASDLDSL